MTELPTGWRPGLYTAEELARLGLTAEALAPAMAVVAEWRAIVEEHARDTSTHTGKTGEPVAPKGVLSGAIANGILTVGGTGRRLPSNLLALVVVSFPPAFFWSEGSGAPRWILPPGLPEGNTTPEPPGMQSGARRKAGVPKPPAVPAWEVGALETAPGTTVLFARIWRKDALFPCLTLRVTAGEPNITLEGLEGLARLSDAELLVRQVRFLERLSAAGAPSLDSRDDWRTRGLRSFELQQEHPRRPLKRLADELFTSKATLCRWRAKLRAEGAVQNY
jgi:hypothetical protein